ncbi:MAG: hypothetical protein HRU43_08015 [Simkaniaceae bacterium]|nr:hypothetical protein [Simkaniaceae bacterium]
MEPSSVETVEEFDNWAWDNLEDSLLPSKKDLNVTNTALRVLKSSIFLPLAATFSAAIGSLNNSPHSRGI